MNRYKFEESVFKILMMGSTAVVLGSLVAHPGDHHLAGSAGLESGHVNPNSQRRLLSG